MAKVRRALDRAYNSWNILVNISYTEYMKKCLTTLAIFITLSFSALAQDDGGTLNFMFSPNPVKDVCYLEVNQPVHLVVLDLRGEVVLEKKLFTSGDLDMRLIEEGIYFLQLSTPDQVKTQRLIKSSFH